MEPDFFDGALDNGAIVDGFCRYWADDLVSFELGKQSVPISGSRDAGG